MRAAVKVVSKLFEEWEQEEKNNTKNSTDF